MTETEIKTTHCPFYNRIECVTSKLQERSDAIKNQTFGAELYQAVGLIGDLKQRLAETQHKLDVAVEALKGLKNWSHWANEKLGFNETPLFPEYKAAEAALTTIRSKQHD